MTKTDLTPRIAALLTRAQALAKKRAANHDANGPIDPALEETHFAEREAIMKEIAACDRNADVMAAADNKTPTKETTL